MEEQVKSSNQKPSLFGMIWSPREQFDRIKENPRIWGALILLSIVTSIFATIQTYTMDFEALMGAEIPTEELALMKITSTVGAVVAGLFGPAIAVLVSSAIYLLIAKISGSDVKFKQLFSMNTYIHVISVLSLVLNTIIGLAIGTNNSESMVTSLGSLIDAKGALGGVLSSIELFSIWSYIVTVIGLQKVANFSKVLSWIIVIVFFLFSILMGAIGGALSGFTGM